MMTYTDYELENIYIALKEHVKNNKKINILKILPTKQFVIEIDSNKILEDLINIEEVSEEEALFMVEYEPDKIKKMTELELEDISKIIFDINAENKLFMYSEELEAEEYQKIAEGFYSKTLKEEAAIFSIYEDINDKSKEFTSEELKKYSLKKYGNSVKIGVISINLGKVQAKERYFMARKKIYSAMKIKESELIDFLFIFNFICKSGKNISLNDIKKVLEREVKFPSIEDGEEFNMKNLFIVKFNLLKITIIEKIYEFLLRNSSNYNEIKKIKETIKIKTSKEILKKTMETYEKGYSIIVSEYIKYINILKNGICEYERKYEKVLFKPFYDYEICEIKENIQAFCFSNFWRPEIYYKLNLIETMKILKKESEAFKSYLEQTEKGSGSIVENLFKFFSSSRSLGDINFQRITGYLSTVDEKSEKLAEFIHKYKMYMEYKDYNNTKNKLIKDDKENIMDIYNDLKGIYKKKNFFLRTSKENEAYMANEKVLNYTYYTEEIDVKKLKYLKFYVVKTIQEESQKYVLQYLGNENNFLCFTYAEQIKLFKENEIKVFNVETLRFFGSNEIKKEQYENDDLL